MTWPQSLAENQSPSSSHCRLRPPKITFRYVYICINIYITHIYMLYISIYYIYQSIIYILYKFICIKYFSSQKWILFQPSVQLAFLSMYQTLTSMWEHTDIPYSLWWMQSIPLYVCHNLLFIYWWDFPGGTRGKEPICQSRRCKRTGFDPWVGKIPQRRAWQPNPVFLPRESHGERSLGGYSP